MEVGSNEFIRPMRCIDLLPKGCCALGNIGACTRKALHVLLTEICTTHGVAKQKKGRCQGATLPLRRMKQSCTVQLVWAKMVTEPDMDICFSSGRHLRTSTRTGSHELTSEMTSCQQTWRSHLGWEAWSPVQNGKSCGRKYELSWRRSYNQAKYIPVYADLTVFGMECL